MQTKTVIIIVAISILLYILAALYSYGGYLMELGEVFGYLFYVVIIAAIIALVWMVLKRPKKEENSD